MDIDVSRSLYGSDKQLKLSMLNKNMKERSQGDKVDDKVKRDAAIRSQ